MEVYLNASDTINWTHPSILELAGTIACNDRTPEAIARSCFEWVRDRIPHSCDRPTEIVTCRASEVLAHGTGLCYAKSHLLAALLRANGIPTGFCYQRLSLDDLNRSYSLHGLNAVFLPNIGWYRIDARGDKNGIQTCFDPPREQLAYRTTRSGEIDSDRVFPEPLPVVVATLQRYSKLTQLLDNLPDTTHLIDG